ncbi:hypothetical protein DRE_00376 [Drechslerella stenobrocha 248]|uniref:Uncharacterized protein n=1 Tax=Drechslerella stenobrocha 248 TaxID=1043628 RepID=W7I5E7_9PEZI|nr:hypothetical protein DRE_00376 [Drechslerella stenobrocha 248]
MCIPRLEVFTEKAEAGADDATSTRVARVTSHSRKTTASPISSIPAAQKEGQNPIGIILHDSVPTGKSSTDSSSSCSSSGSSSSSSSSACSLRKDKDENKHEKKELSRPQKYKYPSKQSRRPINRLNAGYYKNNTPLLRPMTPTEVWQVATGDTATLNKLNPVGYGVPLDCLSEDGTADGVCSQCACEKCTERREKPAKTTGSETKKSKKNKKKDKKADKTKNDNNDNWGDSADNDGWGGNAGSKAEDDPWAARASTNTKDASWGTSQDNSWGADAGNKSSDNNAWDDWGQNKNQGEDDSVGGWGSKQKKASDDDSWGNKDKITEEKSKKKGQGRKKWGKKTDSEKETDSDATWDDEKTDKGKSSANNHKKGQSKKDNPISRHNGHNNHHHHHHDDDGGRAVTVRFRPTVEEVVPEEASEATNLDSVHSPTSLQTSLPKIQIASTPPGCTCYSGTSNASSPGSSTCSTCFIKQQTPRNYVQDLEGHWYSFAPDVDLDNNIRTDVFKGSDGRAYKRISVQKVPPHELRRHATGGGTNSHAQRRHSRHHGHGHTTAVPPGGYNWFPAPAAPVYPTAPMPTAFMKFKRVFRKPSPSWNTGGTYSSPVGGPSNRPSMYGVPVQPARNPSRRPAWASVFQYFAGGNGGGGGGYSSRRRTTTATDRSLSRTFTMMVERECFPEG